MLTLKLEITGDSESDLVDALEAATEVIEAGFTSGQDRNQTGSYSFEITGNERSSSHDGR